MDGVKMMQWIRNKCICEKLERVLTEDRMRGNCPDALVTLKKKKHKETLAMSDLIQVEGATRTS